jgi:hypothetical protein
MIPGVYVSMGTTVTVLHLKSMPQLTHAQPLMTSSQLIIIRLSPQSRQCSKTSLVVVFHESLSVYQIVS